MQRQKRISDELSLEDLPTITEVENDPLSATAKNPQTSTSDPGDMLPTTVETESPRSTTGKTESPGSTTGKTESPKSTAETPRSTTGKKESPRSTIVEIETPRSSTRENGSTTTVETVETPLPLPTTARKDGSLPSASPNALGTVDQAKPTVESHNLWPTTLIRVKSEFEVLRTTEKPTLSKQHRSSSAESAVIRTALGVKAHFKDYCSSTAIHGVRYFAENDRSPVEKIFWTIAITVLMAGCFNRISQAWHKWETSPVIVTYAEYPTNISQVLFPAVSICPEMKSRRTVFNFTEMYHRNLYYTKMQRNINTSLNVAPPLDDDEIGKLEAVSLLCENQVYNDQHYQLHLTEGADIIEEKSIKYLEKIAPGLKYVMTLCRWQGSIINCSELFKPVWSDEGMCFTFNLLNYSELFTEDAVQNAQLNTETDFTPDSAKETQTSPHHALHVGARAGLFVQLRSNETDFDYLCRGVLGFKVLLHNPAEIPLVGQQYFRVPGSQDVVAVVKPIMMTTSDGLYDYAPHRRQCYFPSERRLRFFQVYTQKNCELECLANFTLRKCECVPFYMPRDNKTAVCGPGKRICTENAGASLISKEIELDLNRRTPRKASLRTTDCDCLVSCVSLEYNAETSQAYYNWKYDPGYVGNTTDRTKSGLILSRISIFFKDFQFNTIRRRELYGQTDFIANCGGLLNIFSGFSVLSLLEILYFLTLRLWSRLEKRRRKRSASRDAASNEPERRPG